MKARELIAIITKKLEQARNEMNQTSGEKWHFWMGRYEAMFEMRDILKYKLQGELV